METTSTRTSTPNKPSSIIEERKMACARRPRTFFGESGGFQGNQQNAPNGGNQSDNQKGFGNQNLRANGDRYRVQNLRCQRRTASTEGLMRRLLALRISKARDRGRERRSL